jgi:hypothetical protein
MYRRIAAWIVMLAALSEAAAANAQTSQAYEFWPEINLIYRFDDRNKVIAMGSTSRDRDSNTAYQGEIGAAFDHRFTDFFSARVGYRHANALDGSSFREDRLLAEQTFRLHLPAQVTVDFRTREDLRWLDTGYSMRFRERIKIQRDTTIGSYTFTPYVSSEVYFDTRYDQFSRYRLIAGTNFPVYGPLSIEPYLAHQVDSAPSSKIVDAIGLILIATF